MQLRPMPGYAFPARHLLDTLEDDQILTAREKGNNKVFFIHKIMRRKLVERISADAAYETNLLRQVYKAAVNRICSGGQLISFVRAPIRKQDRKNQNWDRRGAYLRSWLALTTSNMKRFWRLRALL
jgi:hypothetical protein